MLTISPIKAFSDNYIWMLQKANHPQVVLVDPGQAEPVLDHLDQHELEPVAILITHQHYDHTGGVEGLLEAFPNMAVIGPARAPSKEPLTIDLPIPRYITYAVGERDTVFLPELNTRLEVMTIPGHTLDHLAYVGEGFAFCGDTLFAAGCGRLFSGTAEMMCSSIKRLMALPPETRLYCAHEYTVDNLGFAKWVEPDNDDVLERDGREMEKQEQGEVTLPTTVELEQLTNPFARVDEAVVINAAEKYAGKPLDQDWQVFAALREWKDKEYD